MEADFFVNIDFLTWNWNLGKFGHSSLVRLGLDFFNGRFQSDNQHRLGNHPRWALRTHHR
jgi:hypothetical protein